MTRLAVQVAIALAMVTAAFGQTTDAGTKAILQRALAYQFQFRSGQTDIVPEYVAMPEEATKADPENAELWNAMGVAYLAQAARAMMGGRPAAESEPRRGAGDARRRAGLHGPLSAGAGRCGGRHRQDEPGD